MDVAKACQHPFVRRIDSADNLGLSGSFGASFPELCNFAQETCFTRFPINTVLWELGHQTAMSDAQIMVRQGREEVVCRVIASASRSPEFRYPRSMRVVARVEQLLFEG